MDALNVVSSRGSMYVSNCSGAVRFRWSVLGEILRHTGKHGEGLSSWPCSLSWVGVGEGDELGVVAGGSPVAAERSIGLSGEEWSRREGTW